MAVTWVTNRDYSIMRILKEDCTGLIIDIQERLFPHIYQHAELLRNALILLEGLKELKIPLILTEQYPRGLGPTVEKVKLCVEKYNPIEKNAFSCCDETNFITELKQSGRINVIICGIESHVCVLQTVIDLIQMGINPVVVSDCISSRKLSDKEVAIERMRSEGAVITTYESVLFELARRAGTESFKTISRLVK